MFTKHKSVKTFRSCTLSTLLNLCPNFEKSSTKTQYRGSPTSTVSTSTNSTNMIFGAIGNMKLVLVEFLELAM